MRLLVVDDSPINLEVVSLILERNGAVVDTVDSGEAALAMLRDAPDVYDVVLMDIQMPGMDGIETTQNVRQSLRLTKLPVIALTAGALTEEKQRALAAGMNDFLTKPIDPAKLIEALRFAAEHYRGKTIPVKPLDASKPDRDDWPAISGLNPTQAKRLLLGHVGLFLKSLDRMLTEHAGLASPPPDNIDQPDAIALRLQIAAGVHKLRSSGAMVGSERIHQLASEAEDALRASDKPVSPVLTELALVLQDLQQASEETLAAWRLKQNAQSGPATAGANPELAPEVLESLLALLSDSDMSALDKAEEHRSELHAALGDAAFKDFQQHLGQLDFKSAINQLTPLQAAFEEKP
jgi:CheY-like chemotaxis protein/HPt (histidine-containing phosphotransfer) domain-containing protein